MLREKVDDPHCAYHTALTRVIQRRRVGTSAEDRHLALVGSASHDAVHVFLEVGKAIGEAFWL